MGEDRGEAHSKSGRAVALPRGVFLIPPLTAYRPLSYPFSVFTICYPLFAIFRA